MAMSACVSQSPQRRHSSWLQTVPGADREKLRALRRVVMNDPAVRAARERRKRANDEYHEVLSAALLKRDPSLAPVLDKIRKQREKREKTKEE